MDQRAKRRDKEYQRGAHWEKEPSSYTKRFMQCLKPGDKIFDAGCGSGRDSILLAQNGYQVVGMDISPVGIRKARESAKRLNLKIQFDVGDLDDIHYDPKSFDAIYSGYTLQDTDLSKSIHCLSKILKPKGIAHIVMFEDTKYEGHFPELENHIDHGKLLDICESYFTITDVKKDTYSEEDQHGKHSHERVFLALQKK